MIGDVSEAPTYAILLFPVQTQSYWNYFALK